ncbi:MAG: ATP-dependent helicase [Bacteroidetes bacterium]|nr:ATP-dependent helicase [Bacteroidota bacterium]
MRTEQEELAFLTRYNKLNTAQKAAVDTIYGPVMVIAGPGTGKTEVLSMRIAQLLRSDAQVQAQEILCLTYTDEATHAMRKRLVQIIGPLAHKVQIFTFHAFCNTVIQSNPEYFGKGSMQPLSDLERIETIHEIIDKLPSTHTLKRLAGSVYHDSNALSRLFEYMKKEARTSQSISEEIDKYIASLKDDPEMYYKRKFGNYNKGDLMQTNYNTAVEKLERIRAAAFLYDQYMDQLVSKGRYDFQDMILWVLRAFDQNPAILQQYQERFQFILVDEFQDTNGAQSELLYQLTQFWDDPNLFVVGDDDQSIYEFQGARVKNIIEFYQRYQQHIKVVVLTENYRSSQPILDLAMTSIANNQQRLVRQVTEITLNKEIEAKNPRFALPENNIQPSIRSYPNNLQEQADIVQQIEALHQSGVPYSDIAVLYGMHKHASFLQDLLERKRIPFIVKKPIDVLKDPLIENIIYIFRYLQAEREKPFSGEALLFEILHAPYFGISPIDLAKLSLHISAQRGENKTYWRLVLAQPLLLESLNLDSVAALYRMGKCFDNWIQSVNSLSLPLLLEKIVYESGIIEYLLHNKRPAKDLQILHTFFSFVQQTFHRTSAFQVDELLLILEKMKIEQLPLPYENVIQQENGVRLITAHSAKGTEFEYVFLLGVTKDGWEGSRTQYDTFTPPSLKDGTAKKDDDSPKIEVYRRLFFVAVTRAKKALQISYALHDEKGSAKQTSQFIDEISAENNLQHYMVSEEDMIQNLSWAMSPIPEVQIELINKASINQTLQSFNMSYSSLSKYLKCPLAFYYENILKVPFLKGEALVFGSAVHAALELFFKEMLRRNQEFPSLEELIKWFEQKFYFEAAGLSDLAYNRRLDQGRLLLTDYYKTNSKQWSKNVAVEYSVKRFFLDGVPVVGKIDKIIFHDDGLQVIDYKTGNADSNTNSNLNPPNDKDPKGGDYWRQMVFYKLLLENSGDFQHPFKIGTFEYLERSKKTKQYIVKNIPVFEQDEQTVRQQMKQAYTSIMNQEFDHGCGDESCHWCNFARRHELVHENDETTN